MGSARYSAASALLATPVFNPGAASRTAWCAPSRTPERAGGAARRAPAFREPADGGDFPVGQVTSPLVVVVTQDTRRWPSSSRRSTSPARWSYSSAPSRRSTRCGAAASCGRRCARRPTCWRSCGSWPPWTATSRRSRAPTKCLGRQRRHAAEDPDLGAGVDARPRVDDADPDAQTAQPRRRVARLHPGLTRAVDGWRRLGDGGAACETSPGGAIATPRCSCAGIVLVLGAWASSLPKLVAPSSAQLPRRFRRGYRARRSCARRR